MNGGVIGRRNVPGVDSSRGVWSLQEIADAEREGVWPGYSTVVLDDAPLVYYKLDETSGTTATDSSGNGNHGTYINGPTLNIAPLIQDGRAVSFDGTNDRIDGPAVNVLGDVTVEVWYRPSSVSGTMWVMSHAASGETEATNTSYSIRVVGGSLRMLWEDGAGANTEITPGVTLVVGNLYHIVMERDSVAKTVTTTVNGAVITTISYTNNPTGGSSGVLGIGHIYNTEFAAGILDEVAVYDHLLGADRVSRHYNAGIGA